MKTRFKRGMFLAGIGGGALALALSAAPAFAESGADQAGMPSAGRSSTVHASGKVTAIDKGSRTVTVKTKGPKGRVETVEVQDPDNQAKLPSLKPGQVMQFTYTEATVVSLTPAGK